MHGILRAPEGGHDPGCLGEIACASDAVDVARLSRTDGETVDADLVSRSGFDAPAEVLRCDFVGAPGAADPGAGVFVVSRVTAETPPSLRSPIEPPPPVNVVVDCAIPTTTLPTGEGICGQPCSGGDAPRPRTRDALFVLRASVFEEECDPCVCDVDGSGDIGVIDAYFILWAAVGRRDLPGCSACAGDVVQYCRREP